MVSSFGTDYQNEGSVRANVYGNHIISGSSLDISHSNSFGSYGSNTQASAGMTAELLEDMSIIDDLYNEYGDSSEPDEIGNLLSSNAFSYVAQSTYREICTYPIRKLL